MQLYKDSLGKVSITVEEGYWDISKDYDKLTIVEREGTFGTYISRKPVPAGTVLTDRKYWIPFSSLKEEIILNFNKWIEEYSGMLGSQAETLNHLQTIINQVFEHLPQGVTFEGSIAAVRPGFEESISLEADTTNELDAEFVLYKNNEEIYRTTGNTLRYVDTVNTDTEYRLETTQNGYKYISTWNVAVALPLYAGGGETYQDAIGDNKIVKVDSNVAGIYNITVDKDGDYIFFVAPKSSVISSIKMNGLDVPMKATKEVYLGTTYIIYQSDNAYKAGQYPIQINDYKGLDSDVLLGILNSLGDTASAIDVAALKERIDNLPVNELIDKEHNPTNFSGMGRVYLRKNIKNGKNILEQNMMLKANTIYIIQYDFDLDGKEINILHNSILKFEGGSLRNGTIKTSTTPINIIANNKIFYDINIKGEIAGNFKAIWCYKYSSNKITNIETLREIFRIAKSCSKSVTFEGIPTMSIELHNAHNPIDITDLSIDFAGLELNIKNDDRHRSLFKTNKKEQNINIPSSLLVSENIDFTSVLEGKTGMLKILDDNVWTKRYNETEVKRKDILYINNGIASNSVTSTYNNEYSNPICTFIEKTNTLTYIKNLKVNRINSSKITYLFDINNCCDINIENIDVYTELSDKNNTVYGDSIFFIFDCSKINIKNINITNTYSQNNNYGYGFNLNNVSNIQFSDLDCQANWGIFGTNNVNNIYIKNSYINRFEVHTYCKNIIIENVTFKNLYNSVSDLFGYIKYINCNFYNHVPMLNGGSYNAYTNYDLILDGCNIYITKNIQGNNIIKLFNFFSNGQNDREELKIKYLPGVKISNTNITVKSYFNIYDFTDTPNEAIIANLTKEIIFDKVTIKSLENNTNPFRVTSKQLNLGKSFILSLYNCKATHCENINDIIPDTTSREPYIQYNVIADSIKINIIGGIVTLGAELKDNVIYNIKDAIILNLRYSNKNNVLYHIVSSDVYLTNVPFNGSIMLHYNSIFDTCKFIVFDDAYIDFYGINNIVKNKSIIKNCITNIKNRYVLAINKNVVISDELLKKELNDKEFNSDKTVVDNASYEAKLPMAYSVRSVQFINGKLIIWNGTKWVDATGADV